MQGKQNKKKLVKIGRSLSMKTYKELLKESAVANIASGGNVAGMGYNLGKTEGQPMLSDRPADDLAINSKKKRKKFAGCDVFTMPTEDKSMNGGAEK